jgi:hypothetical protein
MTSGLGQCGDDVRMMLWLTTVGLLQGLRIIISSTRQVQLTPWRNDDADGTGLLP